MSDSGSLKSLRTFILCAGDGIGILGLCAYAIHVEASPALVLAVGVVAALPLAAWIGGKGWASTMTTISSFAGKGGGP